MKKLCLFVVVLFVSFSSFAKLQGTFEATSAYSFNLDTPCQRQRLCILNGKHGEHSKSE